MLDLHTVDPDEFRRAVRNVVPYRPLYVKIKLTWRCNLRCAMCTVWRQSSPDRLTLPLIQSLADELASLGTQKIHLSGGEVLLRPDVTEVIRAFAERGMRVNLTTNGTLLTPEMADRLVDSGINNVSISVDGATPSVHDALRGRGNWKRTMRGIHNLRRAARHAKHKLHIRINVVITRRNYRDLTRLPEVVHNVGADRLTLIPVDDATGRLRLNKRRIREYNEEIAPFLAEKALLWGMIARVEEAYPFGREKADLELAKAGLYAGRLYQAQPCYMPWLHALIDPTGVVYPCCMMRPARPLGNMIATGSFRALWEGAEFHALRSEVLDPARRPQACHSCDDFVAENRFLHHMLQSQDATSRC